MPECGFFATHKNTVSTLEEEQEDEPSAINPTPAANDRTTIHHSLQFPVLFILFIGACTTAAFLFIGIRGGQHDAQARFAKQADEVIQNLASSLQDYETAALWMHESCRSSADHVEHYLTNDPATSGICSRKDFAALHEYLTRTGLPIRRMAFCPNVTHANRAAVEEESRNYYREHHPEIEYQGFTGLPPGATTPAGVNLTVREDQPFYFREYCSIS